MKAGDIIGEKYRLERRIGKGANGVVWEARATEGDAPVALKLLLQSANADQQERLLREGRACQRIQHPNVVEVLDVAVEGDPATGGMPFLVMPLLHKKTLAEALLGKPMPLDESIRYLRDIGRGLSAAHAADVVHRDLKPQNVFLHEVEGEDTKVVKILDFGISRINTSPSSLTGADRTLGSPQYMSPEQLLGSKVDQRADLWSFGVIAFQMFARRLPFTGVNVLATLTKVQSGEIPKLPPVAPGVDGPLANLVARCLVREIDARVQTAEECVSALDDLLARLPDALARSGENPAAPIQAPKEREVKPASASAPPLSIDDDSWGDDLASADAAAKPASARSDAPPPSAKPAIAAAKAGPGATAGADKPATSSTPLRRRLGALTAKSASPSAPPPKSDEKAAPVEEIALDVEVSEPAPASRKPPPKPPPKPQKVDPSAASDSAVSDVLADLGLDEAPAAKPVEAAPPVPADAPFEDLRGLAAEAETKDEAPRSLRARRRSVPDTMMGLGALEAASSVLALTPTPAPLEVGADVEAQPTDAPATGRDEDAAKIEAKAAPVPGEAGDAAEADAKPAIDDAPEPVAPIEEPQTDFAAEEDVPAPPRVSRKPLLIGAVAVAGAIVLAIVIAAASGGAKPTEATGSTTPTTSTKPAAPPPPTAPAPPPTTADTTAAPPPSAEPMPSASASASAAPSASTKPRTNPNWKAPTPLAQPTTI